MNPLLDFYRRVEEGEIELPLIQGGPGSGNFGHKGRPGVGVGGSAGKSGSTASQGDKKQTSTGLASAKVESNVILPNDQVNRQILGKYDAWDPGDIRALAKDVGFPDEIDTLEISGNSLGGKDRFIVGLTGSGGNIKKLGVSFSTSGGKISECSIDHLFLHKQRTGRGREIFQSFAKSMRRYGASSIGVRGGKNTEIGESVLPKMGFKKEGRSWRYDLKP
jgi:hypothetical protein